MDTNYKKSCDLWIESQKNYIEDLESRLKFTQRDLNHLIVTIEHEKKTLSEYIELIRE